MKITKYQINTSKINHSLSIACVSDTHARKGDKVIDALLEISPDIILLVGDILEVSNKFMQKRNKCALEFLTRASRIAPVYYCFGNHEIYYSHTRKEINRIPNEAMEKENIQKVKELGINIVNDAFQKVQLTDNEEILIGGLVCGMDMNPALNTKEPNTSFLNLYDNEELFKILLCHYPHYYEKYLKNTLFDLILSGHAHGGQWRFFGRGVFAPGQGLFPKYTSGVVDARAVISRGLKKSHKIPRIFNRPELVIVDITR